MFRISLILVVIYLTGLNFAGPVQPKNDEFTFVTKEPTEEGDVENNQDPTEVNKEAAKSLDLAELDVKNLNSSVKSSDLFVIKTVLYEIGILTDGENDTNFDNKSHEQIDVSFFDPEYNETFVDLSNIPIPFQTNISGVSVTGFIPASFGNLAKLKDGTPTIEGSNFPLLPNKQVKVTHNVSTSNKDESEHVLSDLSQILGLPEITISNKSGSQENHNEDSSEESTLKVEKLHGRESGENFKK